MIWDAISSFASSVTSAVGSIAGSVSSAFSAAVEKAGPMIGKAFSATVDVLKKMPNGIGAIVNAVESVGKIFGVFNQGENVQDMGDRVLQGADIGIVREKYDSFDAYRDDLRNIELNDEFTESTSKLEKQIAGSAFGVAGLAEKWDVEPSTVGGVLNISAMAPDFFDADRIEKYLNTVDAGSLVNFAEGGLSPDEKQFVEDKLVSADMASMPNSSLDDVCQRLYDAIEGD